MDDTEKKLFIWGMAAWLILYGIACMVALGMVIWRYWIGDTVGMLICVAVGAMALPLMAPDADLMAKLRQLTKTE